MPAERSEDEKTTTEDPYSIWCRRLRASDRAAFEALFRAVYADLFRYAKSLTHDAVSAEDAVQEALLRLWIRRATLDPGRSLRALLYVTVRNLALDQERNSVKRQALLKTMDDQQRPPTPGDLTGARMLEARIHSWIAELPERRREAFRLSRFDGLSYAEIASVMGLSIKTVDHHIWLALQHLRRRLGQFEPDLLRP